MTTWMQMLSLIPVIGGTLIPAYGQTPSANWLIRPSQTTVWLGDSITAFGDATQSTGSNTYSWGWTAQAVFLSKGRIKQLYNAGIPGNSCGQVLARFNTDVVPYTPSKVAIACGTNDLPSTPFTSFQLQTETNTYQALLNAALQNGIQPICIGIPPRSDFAAAILNAQTFNATIKKVCAANSAVFVDFWTLLADPATGAYKAGYDLGDHVHPSRAAAVAMGQYFDSQLVTGCLSVFAPNQIEWQPNDPENLIQNALFLSTPYWTAGYGSTAPPAVTTVSGDACLAGNWMQVVFAPATAAGQRYSYNYTNVSAVAGHTYVLAFRIQVSGLTVNGGSINITYGYSGPGPVYAITNDIADGTIFLTAVCPSNVTQFNPGLVVSPTTNAQSITVKIGQAGLYDLTANAY